MSLLLVFSENPQRGSNKDSGMMTIRVTYQSNLMKTGHHPLFTPLKGTNKAR
jgi:hypothetical protein